MSICKNCVKEKSAIQGSYLPCLKYEKELTSGKHQNLRELLCQIGPYQWCTRFCSMSNRQLELRFSRELLRVVDVVKPLWATQ